MDKVLFEQLNSVYGPLRRWAGELTRALKEAGIHAVWGWHANHSSRIDGEYRIEEFPIPVLDVEGGSHQGGCDIGFHMDEIFVEFQLPRELALSFDYTQLPQPFEVYGVADYLHDFYCSGMDMDGIAARITASGEKRVGITLTLSGDADTATLLSTVEHCRRWMGIL